MVYVARLWQILRETTFLSETPRCRIRLRPYELTLRQKIFLRSIFSLFFYLKEYFLPDPFVLRPKSTATRATLSAYPPLQSKCRKRRGDRLIQGRARNIADDLRKPGAIDGVRRRPQISNVGEFTESGNNDSHHLQQPPRHEVDLEVAPAGARDGGGEFAPGHRVAGKSERGKGCQPFALVDELDHSLRQVGQIGPFVDDIERTRIGQLTRGNLSHDNSVKPGAPAFAAEIIAGAQHDRTQTALGGLAQARLDGDADRAFARGRVH